MDSTPDADINMRTRILSTADHVVNGDRNVDYGDPSADFQRTADYWNTYIHAALEKLLPVGGTEATRLVREARDLLDPHDVAVMMMLLKVSRLSWSPHKEDHWVDLAGYSACGAHCAYVEYGELT